MQQNKSDYYSITIPQVRKSREFLRKNHFLDHFDRQRVLLGCWTSLSIKVRFNIRLFNKLLWYLVVNLCDHHGNSALHYAVQAEDSEKIVDALIEAGSDLHVQNKRGVTALHLAAQYACKNTITRLLQCGAGTSLLRLTYFMNHYVIVYRYIT